MRKQEKRDKQSTFKNQKSNPDKLPPARQKDQGAQRPQTEEILAIHVQLARGSYTGAGKQADEATRLVVGPKRRK